jgi:hypothetical protein
MVLVMVDQRDVVMYAKWDEFLTLSSSGLPCKHKQDIDKEAGAISLKVSGYKLLRRQSFLWHIFFFQENQIRRQFQN